MRPEIVGETLHKISQDPTVAEAMFEVLETQKLLQGGGKVVLLPKGAGNMASLLLAGHGGA